MPMGVKNFWMLGVNLKGTGSECENSGREFGMEGHESVVWTRPFDLEIWILEGTLPPMLKR